MAKQATNPKQVCALHGEYAGEECPTCLAVHEDEAEVIAIPAAAPAVERRAVCVCGCAERGHCKGGDTHFNYKLRQGQAPVRAHDITICSTRHCKETLCTCVDFVPAPAGEGVTQ